VLISGHHAIFALSFTQNCPFFIHPVAEHKGEKHVGKGLPSKRDESGMIVGWESMDHDSEFMLQAAGHST
jgi:hypothetical protein